MIGAAERIIFPAGWPDQECQPHHWICEPPNGPEIAATCKVCGRTRTFPASPEPLPYNAGVLAARKGIAYDFKWDMRGAWQAAGEMVANSGEGRA